VFSSGFLVVHDSIRSCEDNVSKLLRGKQVVDPLREVFDLHVKARRNHSGLVQTAVQMHDDLSSPSVVDDFELANVS